MSMPRIARRLAPVPETLPVRFVEDLIADGVGDLLDLTAEGLAALTDAISDLIADGDLLLSPLAA